MNSKLSETQPEKGDVRQNTSDGPMPDKHFTPPRRRIFWVYCCAVLLALVLFYFHVVVIFDVIGELLRYKAWLVENLGPKHSGKLILLGCFFTLMLAHVTEATVWGIYFRWTQLLPTITEGTYFTSASMTTLGYGDILLKYPWRHLSTLIAITGILMFGCSTAFLFVVLQRVWEHF